MLYITLKLQSLLKIVYHHLSKWKRGCFKVTASAPYSSIYASIPLCTIANKYVHPISQVYKSSKLLTRHNRLQFAGNALAVSARVRSPNSIQFLLCNWCDVTGTSQHQI